MRRKEGVTLDFFRKFWWSITKPASYRGFLGQSTGRAMRYLALLVLLVSIPAIVYINEGMTGGVHQWKVLIDQWCPDFKLSNGHLKVYSQMPIISDNGDGTITIIDTGGKSYQSILAEYPTASFIFTRDQIFQLRSGQPRVVDFKSVKFITLTKDNLVYMLSHFRWLNLFVVILGFPIFYLLKIVEALAGALVAMLIGFIIRSPLDYGQAFKISVYALTLPYIIECLQWAVWQDFSYLLFCAVYLIYLVIGVRWATRSPIML